MYPPGLDPNVEGDDLFPEDEEGQHEVLSWATNAFTDAETARKDHEDRWRRYFKMYRSYGGKRAKGDWRSMVWIPVAFYVVETILPRLVAQLPKLTVNPVGPEDTAGAQQMEFLLDYVTEESDLYLELVKAFKSSLIYGTGILKTLYDEKYALDIHNEPVMEPVFQEMPMGEVDINGQPMTQQMQMGEKPTGEMKSVRNKVLRYAGPAGEAVDIFDFFTSPEATDMDSASYVIHRVFRTKDHIEKMAKDGHYRLPEQEDWDRFSSSGQGSSASTRLADIGLGGGGGNQSAKGTKLMEVKEYWTPDVVLTTLGNDSGSFLLRAERNPYAHGEVPFVRVVDHMVISEFWGIGELEPLEGVQDTMNALWNSRIDNVKLVLNQMFAVSVDYLEDPADLKVRPGGVIRLREGVPIDQAIRPIDLGEVTQSSYTEAAEMERMSEKISGVSAYQMGTDSPSLNRTATGVALISEQGNTRFSHKVRISELTGLRKLARHFGAILQQYMPEQMVVRVLGPGGQFLWSTVDAQSIEGAFDYNIEAESASQTESIRREQAMGLFNTLISMPQVNPYRLIEDVLSTFGRKDIQSYMMSPEMQMQQQMMMQQQQMMAQGGGEQPALPPMSEEAPPAQP